MRHAKQAGAGGAVALGATLALCAAHRPQAPAPLGLQPRFAEQVVQPGDTLWTLCEQATGKPWLWPQVWAMNPEIHNPHWIHPGDTVRFVPGGDAGGAARPRMVASAMEPPPEPAPPEPPAPRAAARIEVVGTAPPPGSRGRHALPRAFSGMFIAAEELAAAGTLTQAIPDKILLRPPDQVLVAYPRGQVVQPGERLMISRTVRPVEHPVTHAPWGYMTEVTGVATVQAMQDGIARAVLTYATREVERGQHVTKLVEDLHRRIEPVAGPPNLRGFIVAVEGDRAAVGEQKLVFIDRGSRDGVVRGNRFLVIGHGDELSGGDAAVGALDVATLSVVEARERSATCLVTDALRELWAGEPVHSLAALP